MVWPYVGQRRLIVGTREQKPAIFGGTKELLVKYDFCPKFLLMSFSFIQGIFTNLFLKKKSWVQVSGYKFWPFNLQELKQIGLPTEGRDTGEEKHPASIDYTVLTLLVPSARRFYSRSSGNNATINKAGVDYFHVGSAYACSVFKMYMCCLLK